MKRKTPQPPHLKAATGDVIEFCPATQSWWPKAGSPEGAKLTAAATLDAPALYEPAIGLRTRDIQFTPLADDVDTELDTTK